MADLRERSREAWHGVQIVPTIDELKLGALQRIGDATERMASNWKTLEADRDHWKRLAQMYRESSAKAERSNAALRGAITKLKLKRGRDA